MFTMKSTNAHIEFHKVVLFQIVWVKYTGMASLPSDFSRHSLTVLLGG